MLNSTIARSFIDSSKLNKIKEGHKRKPDWEKLGSPRCRVNQEF